MDALEKYANKKVLARKLERIIYGSKPREGQVRGVLIGGVGGMGLGGALAAAQGQRVLKKRLEVVAGKNLSRRLRAFKAIEGTEPVDDKLVNLLSTLGGEKLVAKVGASWGGAIGSGIGRKLGKISDKKRWVAHKKKRNKQLAGGISAAGLAALLAAS